MFKAILFDIDGVIIAKREKFFSSRLVEDFNISEEDSMEFVKEALIPSMVGKLDLREIFPKYLKKWNISMSVDELFQYWWDAENKVNTLVMEIADQLRSKGFTCLLASDQEKNRAEYLMTEMAFKDHFDKAFFSYDLGMQKHDKGFFTKIIDNIKVTPGEILYWDDDKKNVIVAESVGIVGKYFINSESFKEECKDLKLI
jgi:FMN phosphatase YigB (HAD superfamily)